MFQPEAAGKIIIGSSSQASKLTPGQSIISDAIVVDQNMINKFANCTKDFQWIHVQASRARSNGFGGAIAHGFLTLSLLTALLETAIDTTAIPVVINYGLNKVRFPAPLTSGSTIRCEFVIDSARATDSGAQVGIDCTIRASGQTKPVCFANWILRFYDHFPERTPSSDGRN